MSTFLHLLLQAHKNIDRVTEALLAELPEKLTARQYMVLQVINNFPGINQIALQEKTGIDRSTMSEIVRRLTTKRVATRSRSKTDARAYSIRISVKGKQAIRDAQSVVNQVDAYILASMKPRDREVTVRALQHIAKLKRDSIE